MQFHAFVYVMQFDFMLSQSGVIYAISCFRLFYAIQFQSCVSFSIIRLG
jgi:hypothetical protein